MGIHDGHRTRLRERFLAEGLDSFPDVNVLELLLFYAIPQKDTNELAHALLTQFGSLQGVLDANVADLCKIPGITEYGASLIHLVKEMNRRQRLSSAKADIIRSTREAGEYLMPYFYGYRNEILYLLCLDAKGKVLCCRGLSEGGLNATAVSVRRLVEIAIAVNATNVVIAHNHPGGLAIPSPEDEQVTRQIWSALRSLDIILLDHLIIADEDYVSLADNGLFQQFLREMS